MKRLLLSLAIALTALGTQAQAVPEDSVFLYAEQMPTFVGGTNAMQLFILEHIVYPEEAKKMGIQGKVYAQFIVNKDGSISDIVVKKGIGHGCDEAVIDVIKKMPKWEPARVSGRAERLRMAIPVSFKLNENKGTSPNK